MKKGLVNKTISIPSQLWPAVRNRLRQEVRTFSNYVLKLIVKDLDGKEPQ